MCYLFWLLGVIFQSIDFFLFKDDFIIFNEEQILAKFLESLEWALDLFIYSDFTWFYFWFSLGLFKTIKNIILLLPFNAFINSLNWERRFETIGYTETILKRFLISAFIYFLNACFCSNLCFLILKISLLWVAEFYSYLLYSLH